jgi:hypothetical protein
MDTSATQAILSHWDTHLKGTHLRTLLDDEHRNKQLVSEVEGVLLDYTHEKLDEVRRNLPLLENPGPLRATSCRDPPLLEN